MNRFLQMVQEPSSWAGLALLIQIFAPKLPADLVPAVQMGVGGLAATAAIVLREKAKRNTGQ